MSNGCALAVRVVASLICCFSALAAPAAAQILFVESGGRILAGQSSSPSSSTMLVTDGQMALDPAQASATMRVGFNVNADANPGLVGVEVALLSFDMGFLVAHGGSYDIALDFFLRGEMLRLPDDSGCLGAVSFGDILFPSLVRVEDGAEFPLDVVLAGASFDLEEGTATLKLAEQEQRLVQIRGDTRATSSYLLSVLVSANALSQSCEVSARFGADNGSTTGCDACGYPGSGARERDDDGLFVTATILSLCGDVRTDPGEQCDFGPLNGAADSCCDAFCRFAPASRVCRPAAGECDQSETCSATSGDCPLDAAKPAGSACTADGSLCTDDVCDGSGACAHPLRAGTTCADGLCTCDSDGQFCTGPVSCAEGGGLCIQLPPPCGEDDTCDEDRDLCLSILGTPVPTSTATPRPAATPTATPIDPPCVGDCDGDLTVPRSEILSGVDIALGKQPVTACDAFDRDRDGRVTVDELVEGVANQLTQCPS